MQTKLPFEQIRGDSIFWQPQADITAYELAQALHLLLWPPNVPTSYKATALAGLPENVKRHFSYKLESSP